MKTFLIGNSIVKNVRSMAFVTISLPSSKWLDICRFIVADLQRFNNAVIYVHVGPVEFTRIHRTRSRKECVLVVPGHRRLGDPFAIFGPFMPTLIDNDINIVLCTVFPMSFEAYNCSLSQHRLASGKRNRQIMQAFYDEWGKELRSMIVVQNRLICGFNESYGMATPFCHHTIFKRRRGSYTFRKRFLYDGLHPTLHIVREWTHEIQRVHRLNLDRVVNQRRTMRHQ